MRAGIDDSKAGDAEASVAALTYAAEGGQAIARWKLGEMYADGVGVARDDVKAYHYFNQLVEDYDEDAPDRRNRSRDLQRLRRGRRLLPRTAFPTAMFTPTRERAHELFQYAATIFGDPNAQYNLAHMYIGRRRRARQGQRRRCALAGGGGRERPSALAGAARPYAVHRRRRSESARPRA